MTKLTEFQSKLRTTSPVFLDTRCFVYAFEEHPEFGTLAASIFDLLSDDAIAAFSSTITVVEILTKPYEENAKTLIEKYHEVLHFLPNFSLPSPTYQNADLAAQIRAKYNFRLMDSFQLALAVESDCNLFATNDQQLRQFQDLEVICFFDFV